MSGLWKLSGLAALLLLLNGYSASQAAVPSGQVIAVVQSAEVDGASGHLVLQPASSVYSGDRIVTGSVGQAQVRFADNTKLVIGPNSSMVIDAFVFDSAGTANKFSINAVKGAFRFITGTSAKNAYSITTPTATIGLRGTKFDFVVDNGGSTRLIQLEGSTLICKRGHNGKKRDCVVSNVVCGVTFVPGWNGPIFGVGTQDTNERNVEIAQYFQYVRNQKGLLAAFRADMTGCGSLSYAPYGSSFANANPPPLAPPASAPVSSPPPCPPPCPPRCPPRGD